MSLPVVWQVNLILFLWFTFLGTSWCEWPLSFVDDYFWSFCWHPIKSFMTCTHPKNVCADQRLFGIIACISSHFSGSPCWGQAAANGTCLSWVTTLNHLASSPIRSFTTCTHPKVSMLTKDSLASLLVSQFEIDVCLALPGFPQISHCESAQQAFKQLHWFWKVGSSVWCWLL